MSRGDIGPIMIILIIFGVGYLAGMPSQTEVPIQFPIETTMTCEQAQKQREICLEKIEDGHREHFARCFLITDKWCE